MSKNILIFSLLFFFFNISLSQSEKKEIFVKYTNNQIKADGILDEPDWALAKTASGFYEYFPDYSATSKNQAEIKLMNDQERISEKRLELSKLIQN